LVEESVGNSKTTTPNPTFGRQALLKIRRGIKPEIVSLVLRGTAGGYIIKCHPGYITTRFCYNPPRRE
jgi:hypothetical protein